MRAAIPRTDMQGTHVALFYPQCTTVWSLESERDWNNLGTKQREERESCLRDHRVRPILETNVVLHK